MVVLEPKPAVSDTSSFSTRNQDSNCYSLIDMTKVPRSSRGQSHSCPQPSSSPMRIQIFPYGSDMK